MLLSGLVHLKVPGGSLSTCAAISQTPCGVRWREREALGDTTAATETAIGSQQCRVRRMGDA